MTQHPTTPAGARRALFLGLAALLLVLGAARMFGLVLQHPLHGYANQFDMLKIQACYGIWEKGEGIAQYDPKPATPMSEFEFNKTFQPYCLHQSALLSMLPAVVYAKFLVPKEEGRATRRFNVQWQGLNTAAWFLLAGTWLTWLMRSRPRAALFNALVFCLVITDPFNTLWLNGFYSEAHAVLFAYLSTALLLWTLGMGRAAGTAPRVLLVASTFLFGFSKLQHMFFPALFALVAAADALWISKRKDWRLVAWLAGTAATVIGLQTAIMAQHPEFRASTTADALLGAVLPAATHPERALKTLGLPERCGKVIGLTWFDNKRNEIKQDCPEAFSFSRARFLPLFIQDPSIPLTLMSKALPQTRQWLMDNYLGAVQGQAWGKLESSGWRAWTVSAPLKKLGGTAWFTVYALVAATLLACPVLAWRSARGAGAAGESAAGGARPVPWGPFICAVMVLSITSIAVLGNGYSEVARHAHLSFSFMAVLGLWLACRLAESAVQPLAGLRIPRPRPPPSPDETTQTRSVHIAMNPSTNSPRVAVVIPCYNEALAISEVISEFRRAVPEADIYVFDNNSSDNTTDVALSCGARVVPVRLRGKGNVVRRMFADVDADVYVMVDGDATYDVSETQQLVDRLERERLDMIVGCRVDDGQNKATYRAGHRLGNRVLTGFVGLLFEGRFTDMLSGYRVFSRRFAKSFPAMSKGFETETELTIHALELRMPVAEHLVAYKSRPEGSVSKLSTYRDGWRILKTIFKLFISERPLQFFAILAALLSASGLALAVPLALTYLETGLVPRLPTAVLSTGLMLSAMLALVCGAVLNTVTIGRREIRHLAYLAVPARSPAMPPPP